MSRARAHRTHAHKAKPRRRSLHEIEQKEDLIAPHCLTLKRPPPAMSPTLLISKLLWPSSLVLWQMLFCCTLILSSSSSPFIAIHSLCLRHPVTASSSLSALRTDPSIIFFYLSIKLSTCLSIYLSVCWSGSQSVNLFIYLSLCLSVHHKSFTQFFLLEESILKIKAITKNILSFSILCQGDFSFFSSRSCEKMKIKD